MKKRRWEAAFLRHLADTGSPGVAAKRAGIDRSTPYKAAESDPEFAQRFDDALEDSTDTLEQEARRRAGTGFEEPVIYQGRLCGIWFDAQGRIVAEGTEGATMTPLTIRKYSDSLLALMLRSNRPEKYRDTVDIKKIINEQLSQLIASGALAGAAPLGPGRDEGGDRGPQAAP